MRWRYLRFRIYLHGLACRHDWLTKADHSHSWLIWVDRHGWWTAEVDFVYPKEKG